MTDVVRPGKLNQQVARTLLELATALADDDPEQLSVRATPLPGIESRAPDVSESATTERLTLTVEQAAQVLGISRAHAYELAARGEIPTLRLGRRVLVPKEALSRMVHG